MRKQKTETTEQFELRRSEKCHQIRTENGYFIKRPKKIKPHANRVHISDHPRYWKYFSTRVKVWKGGGFRYKKKTKKGYESIIDRAQFLAAHGRYPLPVVV